MNKADVITKVSEKTGIAPDACEKVIKAFEEQAGEIFGARGPATASILTGMSERIGISTEDCQKVLTALEAVVRDGISDKLGAFTKLFSKS
jgi:hypothetical protein